MRVSPATPAALLDEPSDTMGGSQPFMLVQMAMAKAEAMTRAERWQVALDAYAEAIRLVGNDGLGLATKTDAHRGAGIVQMRCSNWDGAENELLKSQALASELKDDRRLALAKNVRAAVAFERGDWPDAHKLYAAAREHADASGSTRLLAQIDNNQGALWSAVGHQKWAETCFRRALELFDELDNHPCGARTLNNLGIALVAQGRPRRSCSTGQTSRTPEATIIKPSRSPIAHARSRSVWRTSLYRRARSESWVASLESPGIWNSQSRESKRLFS